MRAVEWNSPHRLSMASATPVDRWYGLYHSDEQLATPLQRAYAALGLVPSHIRAVSLAPATSLDVVLADASPVSAVADRYTPKSADGGPASAADWGFLLGPADREKR